MNASRSVLALHQWNRRNLIFRVRENGKQIKLTKNKSFEKSHQQSVLAFFCTAAANCNTLLKLWPSGIWPPLEELWRLAGWPRLSGWPRLFLPVGCVWARPRLCWLPHRAPRPETPEHSKNSCVTPPRRRGVAAVGRGAGQTC